MTDDRDFSGAKIALLCGTGVVSILRDNRPDIPWPNLWDLPGGGREGREDPATCALRETAEELGLHLSPSQVIWSHAYAGALPGRPGSWFFVARLAVETLDDIRFGDEGQCWRLIPVAEFLQMETAIPHLRDRLADFIASGTPG